MTATYETLCKEFQVSGPKVKAISKIIHDVDPTDEKFGAEGKNCCRRRIGFHISEISA
jgi:hypothetical protein